MKLGSHVHHHSGRRGDSPARPTDGRRPGGAPALGETMRNWRIIEVRNPEALRIPDLRALLDAGFKAHPLLTVESAVRVLWEGLPASDAALLVARTDSGEYEGFAMVTAPHGDMLYHTLYYLYVVPKRWGVRDRLLEAAIGWARAHGGKALFTTSFRPGRERAFMRLAERIAPTKLVGSMYVMETA